MIDPVCGMTVEPATAAGRHAHAGRTYYFCSRHCADRFAADPERFLAPAAPAAAPAPAPAAAPHAVPPGAGSWTCPMHPEIVRDGPGACPICGMALEPRVASADEAENPELTDMTRRFWVSLVLTIPLFVLAMGGMLPALAHVVPAGVRSWLELRSRRRSCSGAARRSSPGSAIRSPTAARTCSR